MQANQQNNKMIITTASSGIGMQILGCSTRKIWGSCNALVSLCLREMSCCSLTSTWTAATLATWWEAANVPGDDSCRKLSHSLRLDCASHISLFS